MPVLSEVTVDGLNRMTDRLYLVGRAGRSAFWVLLALAAIIAGAGVVAARSPPSSAR